MNIKDHIRKIAFVGDYLPRKCGIATFTYDLRNAVANQYPRTECLVVPVNDREEGYDYPDEVRFEIIEQKISDYRRAADFLNFSNCDIVSLQHEFGIFGGSNGSHILAFLRELHIPIVTTLHTILKDPTPGQFRVTRELVSISSRLVVMSERGKEFLMDIYQVPENKIDIIPHGIPDMPFVDPNFYKDQFGVEGKYVLLTFGLLSPNKGIEYVLKALPKVVEQIPNIVYIVLGATHPNLIRKEGEAYRLSLERLARDLGIKKHVIFYNHFVELEELKEFIGATDIYITPYLNPAQITSGTLSYSFGCGKAVISTPYWHAEELLSDERGVLVPFKDSDAIAREIVKLLQDEPRRHAMRKRAYMLGRQMVWSNVAHLYMESFQKARHSKMVKPSKAFAVKTLEEKRLELPSIRINHLLRMTDSTGIFQHAKYSMPDFHHGYCTDDNARALLLTLLLEEAGFDSEVVSRLFPVYASFLNYAYDRKTKRFHNFMSFDRRWLDEVGSEDCQGRAIWALGACVGRANHRSWQMWAMELFEEVISIVEELNSPRAWAFALMGIHEYCRRMSGDRIANQFRAMLSHRLMNLYEKNATSGWLWFENKLTYDNAKLSHALILSGKGMKDDQMLDTGLESLRWLNQIQTVEAGHFRPIGSNGFFPKNGNRADFDQQPLEAYATTSACLEAYRATGEVYWYDQARKAFEWFLGRNDLGQPLYDPRTGGCHDALHVDRLNQNQGAESTLAFLLALVEMHLMETSIHTFSRPVENEQLELDTVSNKVGHSSHSNE